MLLQIRQNAPNLAVFQYEFENRIVFVGHGEFSDVENFGKFCKILDLEFQRRLGSPDNDEQPEVKCTVLWTGTDEHEARRMVTIFEPILKPVWNSPFDPATDKERNPHVLHVERKMVFASLSSAAAALGISHPNAASMLNRPMFAGQRAGAKPRNHLVTTAAPFMHDLRFKREPDLALWRAANGYSDHTRRTHDPQTGERIRSRR